MAASHCRSGPADSQQKLAVLEKIQGKFTFVVIGDNRSGDDIYQKIVSLAMERKPDFIVNNGDMIVTPGNKKEWANFWAMSKPITVPYFLTVGNHDVNPRIPLSEKTYKAQVDLPGNELYYSFVAGNSLFIVLDSYLDDQEKRITGEQFTWLETVLCKFNSETSICVSASSLVYRPWEGASCSRQSRQVSGKQGPA